MPGLKLNRWGRIGTTIVRHGLDMAQDERDWMVREAVRLSVAVRMFFDAGKAGDEKERQRVAAAMTTMIRAQADRRHRFDAAALAFEQADIARPSSDDPAGFVV